jgi:actin-like ATPase involved in cell morphogenesis
MSISVDVGTYNLVSCKRGKNNEFEYKKEVNAFLELPLENRFVFNMMKNAGVPLIERDNVAYALGEAAVNMAYTMSALELKRPMKDGCVNPNEKDSFQISGNRASLVPPR